MKQYFPHRIVSDKRFKYLKKEQKKNGTERIY